MPYRTTPGWRVDWPWVFPLRYLYCRATAHVWFAFGETGRRCRRCGRIEVLDIPD